MAMPTLQKAGGLFYLVWKTVNRTTVEFRKLWKATDFVSRVSTGFWKECGLRREGSGVVSFQPAGSFCRFTQPVMI